MVCCARVPHYGTHITGQVSSASGTCQILCGVESVCVQHKVSVGQVTVKESELKYTSTYTTKLYDSPLQRCIEML